MRIVALSLLLLGALPVAAQNLSEDQFNQVFNNISHEYTICAAYFTVVAAAVIESGDAETGEEYMASSNTALQFAVTAGKAGRSEEMALKVTKARLEIEAQAMMNEIENDAANISLLYAKHSERCIWVMNNTIALLEEWTTRILNQQMPEG